MPAPPTAAIEPTPHPSLQAAGLHDLEPPRNRDADPLTATAARGDGLGATASSTLWMKHREEELLRNLAHKLRNPLAPIVTCVQILQSRALEDRLLHHALDLMDRQLTRMVRMLDELRGASRNGGIDVTPETQPTRLKSGITADEEARELNGHPALDGVLGRVRGQAEDKLNLQPNGHLKHRVLVVDDNPDAAEALRLLLCIKGFEVFTASDGLEAIERTKECAPEVIFMDLEMSTMDGCEAAKRIHAMPACESIPIVALTALDHESDRERSRRSGMVEHLVKPVEGTVVQELLRSLITRGAGMAPFRAASPVVGSITSHR